MKDEFYNNYQYIYNQAKITESYFSIDITQGGNYRGEYSQILLRTAFCGYIQEKFMSKHGRSLKIRRDIIKILSELLGVNYRTVRYYIMKFNESKISSAEVYLYLIMIERGG